MAMEIAHRFIGSSMALSVGKSRNGVSGITSAGLSSVSALHVPRRMFMQLAGMGSVLTLLDFPGLAAPVPEMKGPEVIRVQDAKAPEWRKVSRYYSLARNTIRSVVPSGVDNYELLKKHPQTCTHESPVLEIIEGEGPEAHEGDLVELNYVCRRANGYFVHSTVDQFSGESSPVKLILDENDVIAGLKEVLVGMKAGGKRRALIPPSVGYINETLKPIPEEFGPRRSLLSHAKEPLVFEVQLLKVL